MIVVMKADASQEDLDAVKRRIVEEGLRPSVVEGAERSIVGVLGTITRDHESAFEGMSGVLQILRVSRPYKLASREFPPCRHRGRRRRRQDRRRRPRRHGGAMLRRVGGAGRRHGAGGEGRGREHPARRRIQAPHLAL